MLGKVEGNIKEKDKIGKTWLDSKKDAIALGLQELSKVVDNGTFWNHL